MGYHEKLRCCFAKHTTARVRSERVGVKRTEGRGEGMRIRIVGRGKNLLGQAKAAFLPHMAIRVLHNFIQFFFGLGRGNDVPRDQHRGRQAERGRCVRVVRVDRFADHIRHAVYKVVQRTVGIKEIDSLLGCYATVCY